jgi:hypothetical protein
VQLDTVVYVDPKSIQGAKGTLIVSVKDPTGAGVSGAHVTGVDSEQPTNSFSLDTGSDGCLYFPSLTPSATMSVTIVKSGYIALTPPGTQQTLQIVAGSIAKGAFQYSAPAALSFTSGDTSHPLPGVLPVSWHVNATNPVVHYVTVATPPSGLWPDTGGVTVTGGFNSAAVAGALLPGQTTSVVLPSAPVFLRGMPKNVAVSGTSGGTSLALGTTDSMGQLNVSLPYGMWSFTCSGQTQTLTTPLAAPPGGGATSAVRVDFTLANLDGLSPSPTPSPTASPTGSSSASPTVTPSPSVTP